jgi:hypothetical protein
MYIGDKILLCCIEIEDRYNHIRGISSVKMYRNSYKIMLSEIPKYGACNMAPPSNLCAAHDRHQNPGPFIPNHLVCKNMNATNGTEEIH